ncbi:MAG: tRNA uridine-5-carboxymethylaminomethyl(34) synthesis GTPase MnmE, partial [Bacteroidia bacterium]
ILIYLFDASAISEKQIEKELEPFKDFNGTIILVANKIDLLNRNLHSFIPSFPHSFISISSLQKSGISELKDRLLEVIQKQKVNSDVVITNFRHYEALKNTADALQDVLTAIDEKISSEILAADIRRAIFHLSEITGEITTEDLLDNIFSRFCIGK